MQFIRSFVLLAALALLALPHAAALAQEAAVADNLKPVVEQARKDGSTVIIISPQQQADKAASAAADERQSMTDTGLALRNEIRRLVVSAPAIPDRLGSALEILSPDGTLWWLLRAVATAIGGLAVGFYVSRFAVRWGREQFRGLFMPEPQNNAQKIGFLLFRAGISVVNITILFIVAAIVAVVFDYDHQPSRRTVFVILFGYALWRVLRFTIASNLLAPDLPKHRMLNISDADAQAMYTDFNRVMAIAITVVSTSQWIAGLDLDGDLNKLLLIFASFIAAGLISYVTLKYRKAVAGAILGAGDPDSKPAWRRFVASSWHVFGLVYLVAATGTSIVRLLLNLPSANILISAPAVAVFGAIGVYAVLYMLIEGHYRLRQKAFDRRLALAIEAERRRREAEEKARAEAMNADGEIPDEVIVNLASQKPIELPRYNPMFKGLAQSAAALIVTFFAIGSVLEAWSIRTSDGKSLVAAFMQTLLVAFIAWILYRAVAIYADAKLAEEAGPDSSSADLEESMGGHGSSRLGTLLPLLRNVLIAVIFAVAGMIVLSNMGVDIAPLFAGAGVVGLAVGFGAQTLIRDIFSGGFFLFDDAFRKGEYIELGNIRGTVEKISLRSFQLRHHNGPLHTVPFGEITQLTNYSRDWVIMKLPLRLTYDTDVEKVRKLVKKLGQQLLDHPEIGKSFLQPLKSQGVTEMDDSAIIVRVKFMTRPGDQWVARKVVYAAIQELFRREGIRFANREVTVHIAEQPNRPLSDGEKEAVAAAARQVIEDKQPAPAGDDR
jgi:small-conductance mechanosensitive channel